MDLKQLEYMVAIADHGNISKAAASLFITPSGLNQQLIKLEKELGVQLFYRNKHSLRMTQAGAIYVNGSREILHIRKNTYTQLDDLKGNTTGEIRLGLTHEHGIDLFTSVFPEFNRHFPGITFFLQEAIVAQQHTMIHNGELDLGIVMLDEKEKADMEYIKIYNENLVLGISRSHPMAKYASKPGEPLTVIDLSLFRDDKFSLIFSGSTMRRVLDPVFKQAGFQPKIQIETAMNHALVKLVRIGLCCTIIPQSRAEIDKNSEEIAWFYLSSRPNWNVYFVHRRDTQFSEATRFFIQLAQIYGVTLEQNQ